jgi:hypothetical protein
MKALMHPWHCLERQRVGKERVQVACQVGTCPTSVCSNSLLTQHLQRVHVFEAKKGKPCCASTCGDDPLVKTTTE